jgi:hypothetical protein
MDIFLWIATKLWREKSSLLENYPQGKEMAEPMNSGAAKRGLIKSSKRAKKFAIIVGFPDLFRA